MGEDGAVGALGANPAATQAGLCPLWVPSVKWAN